MTFNKKTILTSPRAMAVTVLACFAFWGLAQNIQKQPENIPSKLLLERLQALSNAGQYEETLRLADSLATFFHANGLRVDWYKALRIKTAAQEKHGQARQALLQLLPIVQAQTLDDSITAPSTDCSASTLCGGTRAAAMSARSARSSSVSESACSGSFASASSRMSASSPPAPPHWTLSSRATAQLSSTSRQARPLLRPYPRQDAGGRLPGGARRHSTGGRAGVAGAPSVSARAAAVSASDTTTHSPRKQQRRESRICRLLDMECTT